MVVKCDALICVSPHRGNKDLLHAEPEVVKELTFFPVSAVAVARALGWTAASVQQSKYVIDRNTLSHFYKLFDFSGWFRFTRYTHTQIIVRRRHA